jgi:enoyl-CoA hydratase
VPDTSVRYEKRDSVAWLTLNRPAVLNAINLEMRDELWEALGAIRYDPDVAAVVVRGAGERAFSAGADITEFGSAPSYLAARSARRNRDLWAAMLALEKPMVAAIHGFAYGAGCEMSLCCDLRIASSDAKFALPEVALGYIPSAGGTQLLPRTIGPAPAMQMILSGNPIDSARALRLGLIHRVVEPAELEREAAVEALKLASLPGTAIALAKRALAAAYETDLKSGMAIEARLAALALHG